MAPAPNTSSWLVIDDTSLLLVIAIVTLLLLSALLNRWYNQPTIHPLILGRQSDVSQVRKNGQSPIYRNANSPHGFDLATRPRKGAVDIKTLLTLGAKGDEYAPARTLYGTKMTTDQLLQRARKFGSGLLNSFGSTRSFALAVCVDRDHLEALEALLAASLLSQSSTGKVPFSTLVVSPVRLPQGQPRTFPTPQGYNDVRLAAVYTTPKAIAQAAAMSIVDTDTLFILATQQDVLEAQRALSSSLSSKLNFVSYNDILSQGSDVAHHEHQPTTASSQAIHSSFWLGDSWVPVTNLSLCAGVTSNLSFYPADGVPSVADRIWVEQPPYGSDDPSSLHLGAMATPAGFALALTALFTGSSLNAGPLTSSLNNANPTTFSAWRSYKPTLIYTSPLGASHLSLALVTLSKRSPIAALCNRGQLRSLRHGAATSRNTSLWDALLFRSVRKNTATDEIKSVTIVGRGWVVGQELLDILRIHLGCPVSNSFLPGFALQEVDDDCNNHKEQSTTRQNQSGTSLTAVWTTSPLSQSHVFDVQSFRANDDISEIPAHVGPPSVAVEVRTQSSQDLSSDELKGYERFLSKGDTPGVVCLRGPIVTAAIDSAGSVSDSSSGQWFSTAQPGAFRSNGTLLLLPPSVRQEEARPTADGDAGGKLATATLSVERPAHREAKVGIGAEQRAHEKD